MGDSPWSEGGRPVQSTLESIVQPIQDRMVKFALLNGWIMWATLALLQFENDKYSDAIIWIDGRSWRLDRFCRVYEEDREDHLQAGRVYKNVYICTISDREPVRGYVY